jgi:hypothetical protein
VPELLAKKLSVTNVHYEPDLAERNDRSGDVIERDEAALEFFVSDEQLAEAVEPAMANLDHPAPRLPRWISFLGSGFPWATDDVRNVAVRFDDFQCPPAAIAGIGTQMLAAPDARGLALDHDGPQHRSRPSTSRCRLLPFFFPIRRVGAHSADRGHPFQADRGQRSGRSRTHWVGCLSDGLDGRRTFRHQFGTLSAMSAERGVPGCPRGALAPGGQPGAEGVLVDLANLTRAR